MIQFLHLGPSGDRSGCNFSLIKTCPNTVYSQLLISTDSKIEPWLPPMLIEFLHLGDRPGLYIMSATKNRPFALLGTKAAPAGKIEYPGGNLGFKVATYSYV